MLYTVIREVERGVESLEYAMWYCLKEPKKVNKETHTHPYHHHHHHQQNKATENNLQTSPNVTHPRIYVLFGSV